MEQLNEILSVISDFVWGVPMSSILLVTGIFLTTRLLFVQFRGFAHGVAITSGTYDDPDHKGQLTHFQALSAALSATIGIGNIGGVAIGIYFGGPGAIFWMWVSALFGMAIKFSECTLAIKYRKVEKDGNILGGPMYFIELGLHRYFKPLAYMFAFCTAFAALGSGNMVQSNTVADSLVNVLKVGYRTVVRSQIESAELNTLAEQYNASLETTATVNTRKLEYLGMETSAAANHGRDWPTIEHIRTEITTSNELLTTLGENTQGYRDRLKKMRFVSADLGNDELKFYPEGTIPAGVETDGRIWRLRVVNDPISNAEINLVDIGPVGTWRWIMMNTPWDYLRRVPISLEWFERAARFASELQVSAVNLPHRLLNDDVAAIFAAWNVPLSVWTVNAADTLDYCLKKHVLNITTLNVARACAQRKSTFGC